MKSHIAIICIIMLSFFSMHEYRCVGSTIGRSSKIYIPLCFHNNCIHPFKDDCWCCLAAGTKKDWCWLEKDFPDAKELCMKTCTRKI
ncbi:EMBRYO SURROUNDING FACTOR 1-like protein 2 [Arabidopsis thaliana]|uniref:EMBRYO SURROUNDING FACTOR 1-like protein 2 n=2 Tax=Arabidopsis thaliana TaxID=3702 RepID=ESFL2_ARATH|nr:EMBRYO SURROUNDING FACTOR-like protein [Arabidopsis thaliana]P0DKH1.1 RecName: Full=EMBRYO SURROUNDING FACTOR 1-like protein 2; Flags: Precursor [Arabidopsis thaliana]ANM60061.1 EMBRYO SURROUNDING FACTOR-like protein [Arabidopsis thaliana]VYS45661.1 unnamed protein product [Arabidopsis thaliana]|eukprot:NP_001322373.1 EMBRYO SURROUNDING FACTOR-like protein [Arabidopsis thaliana]